MSGVTLSSGVTYGPGPSALDLPLRLTFFRDHAAQTKDEAEASLRSLIPRLRTTTAPTKAALPWLKLATFGALRSSANSLRHNPNVREVYGIEADYDGERITLERARQVLTGAGIAAILYTSPSHTDAAPRWRILCPLSAPIPPASRAHMVARLNGLFVGALAAESFTVSQAYYYGRVEGNAAHEVVAVEGRALDEATELDEHAVGRPEKPKQPVAAAPRPVSVTDGDGTPYGLAGLAAEAQAIRNAPPGYKWETINRSAYSIGGLVTAGQLHQGPAYATLRDAVYAIRSECKDFDHALETLRKGFEDGMAQPRQAPPPRQVQHTVRVEIVAPPEPPPYDALPDWVQAEPEPAQPDEWIDPETGEVLPEKPRLKPPGPGLPLVYFEDAHPNLDAADFIEELLIERAMSVVYGPSNCGKTFFVTDLALHVAAGWQWRGREVERGGVIYCALEGSHGILNRVAAFRQEHQIADAIPFAVIPVTLNMLDPSADTDRVIAAIREATERMGVPVAWVIMDTLSRAIAGGNENSPEDMGALVTNGARIQQEAGCHLTWIHHSGKDQAQGARGHSLLRAATDTEIEISRADSESPSVARVTKQREMEIDGEFVFTLRAVELGTNRRGKPVTSCVVEAVEGEAPTRQRRLSAGAQEGLKALQEALAKHGRAVTNRDIPENVPVVHGDLWRQEFFARSTRDTDEATRKAFYRSIKDLMGAGRVGYLHKMAWIVRANDD